MNVLTWFTVLYSDCLVDGNSGDGTARGTCPESYLCEANGECKPPGIFYQLSINRNIFCYIKLYGINL